jgi:hypothetical protein
MGSSVHLATRLHRTPQAGKENRPGRHRKAIGWVPGAPTRSLFYRSDHLDHIALPAPGRGRSAVARQGAGGGGKSRHGAAGFSGGLSVRTPDIGLWMKIDEPEPQQSRPFTRTFWS